jgi:hypothetical protein
MGIARITPLAEQAPGDVDVIKTGGQTIVGTIVSVTVTLRLQFVEFPTISIAVNVTVVIPKLNT